MGYVGGQSRGQGALFPVALDDLVPEDHLARVIDAYVAGLNLKELGFEKAEPAARGRPPYDPADLLRLYLYGYLNQVRSSRRLECECARNVEVMWLLNRLVPDHKTISDFRRLNAAPFKAVCRSFVRFCAQAELIGGQWVAIDGSKFQAVSSRRTAMTKASLEAELASIDRHIEGYLETLDATDETESEAASVDKQAVREALARLQQRRADVETSKAILTELKQTHHVSGEPEAKLMRQGEGPTTVAYNVQTAVDEKNKLVVHHELTNEANDLRSLFPVAVGAKEALGRQALNVVADAGYASGEQLKACEDAGITPYVPVQGSGNDQGPVGGGGIYFTRSAFEYDPSSDSYRCPAGEKLVRIVRRYSTSSERLIPYTTTACGGCALKAQCTPAKRRLVMRHVAQEAIERTRERMQRHSHVMALRRTTVEHPFANLKYRILGNGRFLVRGIQRAAGEVALAVLAYNFRRVLNLLGATKMKHQFMISQA